MRPITNPPGINYNTPRRNINVNGQNYDIPQILPVGVHIPPKFTRVTVFLTAKQIEIIRTFSFEQSDPGFIGDFAFFLYNNNADVDILQNFNPNRLDFFGLKPSGQGFLFTTDYHADNYNTSIERNRIYHRESTKQPNTDNHWKNEHDQDNRDNTSEITCHGYFNPFLNNVSGGGRLTNNDVNSFEQMFNVEVSGNPSVIFRGQTISRGRQILKIIYTMKELTESGLTPENNYPPPEGSNPDPQAVREAARKLADANAVISLFQDAYLNEKELRIEDGFYDLVGMGDNKGRTVWNDDEGAQRREWIAAVNDDEEGRWVCSPIIGNYTTWIFRFPVTDQGDIVTFRLEYKYYRNRKIIVNLWQTAEFQEPATID